MTLELIEKLINDLEMLSEYHSWALHNSVNPKDIQDLTQGLCCVEGRIDKLYAEHRRVYIRLIESGLFFELFPELTGCYHEDFPQFS